MYQSILKERQQGTRRLRMFYKSEIITKKQEKRTYPNSSEQCCHALAEHFLKSRNKHWQDCFTETSNMNADAWHPPRHFPCFLKFPLVNMTLLGQGLRPVTHPADVHGEMVFVGGLGQTNTHIFFLQLARLHMVLQMQYQ